MVKVARLSGELPLGLAVPGIRGHPVATSQLPNRYISKRRGMDTGESNTNRRHLKVATLTRNGRGRQPKANGPNHNRTGGLSNGGQGVYKSSYTPCSGSLRSGTRGPASMGKLSQTGSAINACSCGRSEDRGHCRTRRPLLSGIRCFKSLGDDSRRTGQPHPCQRSPCGYSVPASWGYANVRQSSSWAVRFPLALDRVPCLPVASGR